MPRCLLAMIFVMALVLSTGPALALEVVDVVMTTAIADREPVDHVEVFPRASGLLYCFTRIMGAEEPTVVYHYWYFGEQLMTLTRLPVQSSNWRTWSAKRFPEGASGEWRVEIRDAAGHLLQQVIFELI